MHKTLLILAGTLGLLIGGGAWLLDSNPAVKSFAIDVGLLSPPPPKPLPKSSNAVFLIGDPSGSGKSRYSVPHITIDYVVQVIDAVQRAGSGEVWLTFIDMNASNNLVLHLSMPEESSPPAVPVRHAGERKAVFDKRMAAYRTDSLQWEKIHEQRSGRFEEERAEFLADCQALIDQAYGPKKRGTDYSDVIGSLNAGHRSLETIPNDSTHFRSVILASDGEQTYHSQTPRLELPEFDDDISVIVVNHSGSRNSVLDGRSIDVDNLDRALMYAVRSYKSELY